MRAIMALAYAGFGIVHLTSPETLVSIVPEWVPQPRLVVILTGWCELFGAVGLLTSRFRKLAGGALALYAVCVFPANIKHATDAIVISGIPTSWWYHAPRLAFQPVLVWWALFSAELISWPLRKD